MREHIKNNYNLVNLEGCLMDNTYQTSYKKAYEYFKNHFGVGNYRIYFNEKCKNVSFKDNKL